MRSDINQLIISPRFGFFVIIFSVFFAEALVMTVLQGASGLSNYEKALLDATLLVILISPAHYFFIFTPLVKLINDRRRIESLLIKHEEDKFSTMLRTSIDGFWIVDIRGRFLDVNDAYCKLIGYDRADFLKMRIADIEAIESKEDVAQRISKIIAAGSDRFESKHRSKDGKIINVEVSTNFSPLHGGRFYCFLRDITERKKYEKTLLNTTERLSLATRAGGVGIWDWDIVANSLIWDDQMYTLYGIDRTQFVGSYEAWRSGIHPEDLQRVDIENQLALNGVKEFDTEFRVIWPNGSIRHIRAISSIERDASGRAIRMIGTNWDRTERKASEDEIHSLLGEQKAILENDLIGIVKVRNRIITWANPYFEKLLGVNQGELNGVSTRIIYINEDAYLELGAAAYPLLNSEKIYRTKIQLANKYGSLIWVEMSGAMLDIETQDTLWLFSDISENMASEQEVQSLAFYDPLTNLPNRRLLVDRLNQALLSNERSGRDGAVIFLDLDHFKTLNDTLGHNIGDLLLKQVAKRLLSCVREGDTVSRLGGDEFVVMLEDLSEHILEAAAQTEIICEKIIAALNQPYLLDSYEYQNTPSIGVALFSDHSQSYEDLLKYADIAMYQAKRAGRNTVRFFDPHMQDAINIRANLERELRIAVDKKQFQLHYQMQVDANGHIFGAESLIRWTHPVRGPISPFHFIPLAEDTGLILPIGQWVLDTACAQLKQWQNNAITRDLILAINVSAKQFHQADFVAKVQYTIQHHAIDPTRLKLELTESMLVDNIEDIIEKMTALRKIGIKFSLDDFGTGYSSLQYLKKLPLDQLKIDQSFVRDINIDSHDRAIVRTIIAMAHSMELEVIAEGVEREEQHQRLMDKGCKYFQGYLFSKPLPINELELLLEKM